MNHTLPPDIKRVVHAKGDRRLSAGLFEPKTGRISGRPPGLFIRKGVLPLTVSWATNTSIVIEACTNLANPYWMPLVTNQLVNGTNYFSDSAWTNAPHRFYRIRLP